ncbi:MAG: glutathione S-transferase family protein [Kiloniellales bacterium]|nr:glutathione S-transferase family protein [Kiloniellales bacterium]
MPEVILHHYPPSPVSEKVRKAFGLKGMSWYSVEQNRLPDRPELFAMTGGYRRIPVMQIGADIYCDTQCILRALEEAVPEPSLFPEKTSGLAFGLSRWTDGPLLDAAVRLALVPMAESLPPAFAADRARLYFGPDWDYSKEAADLPHTLAQLRAQLSWLEDALKRASKYISGETPGMADLLVWYLIWLIRGRYDGAETFLAEFSELKAWAGRIEDFGTGHATEMSPQDALGIAKESQPQTPEGSDPLDPQGLRPGMRVTIAPIVDSGEAPIEGLVRRTDVNVLTLSHSNTLCGEVAVHFPRVGYRVHVPA